MSYNRPRLYLPDLIAMCPFRFEVNPHFAKVAPQSSAWIDSFNVFSSRKRAILMTSTSELLCAYSFPYAQPEEFRTCCDFANLLFTLDEISDDQNGNDARATGERFLKAMRTNQHDDHVVSRITADFKKRVLARPWKAFDRFVNICEDYLTAVGKEADLREVQQVLDLESYTKLRRENSAVRTCFMLFEYVTGKDLPEEIWEDAAFNRLNDAAVDMVAFSNDLYSYDMEQAKGHTGNNLLTVLQQEKNYTLQEACDELGRIFQGLIDGFIADKEALPQRYRKDPAVQAFVQGLEYWSIGNLHWSLDGTRYFGTKHEEVKRTSSVLLRPLEIEVGA